MPENVGSPDDLAGRLISALSHKQDEMDRVSRVLHEDIGQVLTVIGLQLDVLRQDYSAQAPEIAVRCTEIQQLLEKAVSGVRELSYQLNPGIVPRSGLRYAMDTLIGRMRESAVGVTIRFLMDSHAHLPPPVAVAVYEIAEHALSNALKHSQADLIEVVLQPILKQVRLEVSDNGRGFDVAGAQAQPSGLGLLWMRNAAAKTGLAFSIESAPGKGTVIQAVYREGTEGETRNAPTL